MIASTRGSTVCPHCAPTATMDHLDRDCERDGCLQGASKRCSGCKTAYYCGSACQKADWNAHQKECKMNAILNKYNEEQARRPPPRPDPARCTGCHDAFRVDDDDDDEGVTPTDECPDCGYMACESCSCHHSRGSCYCTNSNFGRKYCGMDPAWYHSSSHGGGSYQGDYHPEDGWKPSCYESAPRKCNNCGEMKLCLVGKGSDYWRG